MIRPRRGVLYVALLTLVSCAGAQQPKTTLYDRAVWGGVLVTHVADFSLTEECIKRPYAQCHEGVLGPIPQSKAGFGALELGFSASQVEISKYLRRHKHIRWARAWDMTNLVSFGAVDFYVYKLAK